jgi:hypothetical protein
LGMASVSELPEFSKLVEHIKLPQTAGLNQQPSALETPPQIADESKTKQTETAEPKMVESDVPKKVDDVVQE